MKNNLTRFLLLILFCCSVSFSNAQPAQVQKSNPTKVYIHYMPWFDGPTNPVPGGNYTWGYHWKMNTRDPNVIVNGQRQIASNYYPMIGPYASSDPDVVEYHLLLMKLSGIDGVIVDWYGTQGSNGDVGSLLTNSNALINKTSSVGINFGLILEDRFWNNIQYARNSVAYARDNYFNKSNYIRVGSAPLVGVFGPITYQSGGQWSDILSNAGQDVEFLPLWDHAGLAAGVSDGEYTWVYNTPANDFLARLDDYYRNRAGNQKTVMSVAYPRYNDYYSQGGAGSSLFYIDDNNGQTLNQTLALCDQYKYNTDMVQLCTFNDFGEGTVFEPTTQYGFRDLGRIQQYTGVPYTQADLQQVYRLFTLRKKYAGNSAKQSQLTTAFNNFVALRIADAKAAMDAADGIVQVPQSPYGGTARNIPGKIETEDFDNGGQGVAYNDVDLANNGGQYRTNESVDLEACSEGGYNLGWTVAGEWLEYTVNVTTAGTYTVQARLAATAAGKTFHLELDGVNIGTISVPNTGGWQTWQTASVTTPSLSTGQKVLRIALDQGDFNVNYLQFNLNATVQAPVVSSAATANGTVNSAFSYTITASNTPTSYGATGLPAGLSVNTTSGVISGTPTTSGTFNVTVSAANAGGTGTKAVTFTIAPAVQSPFGGTPAVIPGKIEAENFDNGGQGVAYNDAESLNQGGQYRTTEGVDIETSGDGGYDIGWTNAGEWLEYTVNVTSAGTYTVQVRVASPNTGKSLHLELDGVNIGTVAIPNTGGWQTWQTVSITTPALTTGQKILKVSIDTDGFNLNYVQFNLNATVQAPVVSSAATANGTVNTAFSYSITASNTPTSYGATGLPAGLSVNTSSGLISGTPTTSGTFNVTVSAANAGGTGTKAVTFTIAPASSVQSPFGGTPAVIPGKIEAENFDTGGQGVAYNDAESLNQGGQYRTTDGVDIEASADGGYNVGWTNAGEWLEYTVNVTSAGTYTVQVRVASPNTGKSLHLELDGANIGTVAIPNTGGWQTWQTVSITTPALTTGQKVLKVSIDTDGFNLNYLQFNLNGTPVTPVITSASAASATVGSAFNYSITAANSPTSYGATGLPAGLNVNTTSGVISGTPTAVGTYSVTISATNTAGTGSQALSITVVNATDPAGVITCYKAPGAIAVDGSLTEAGWNITRGFSKITTGLNNNTATFGVLWDNTYLYVGAKILDANLFSDSPNMWDDDAIEIYIDANNNRSATYDGKDNQILKSYNNSGVTTQFALTGLQHGWASIAGGYTMEFAIPWSQLGITSPAAGLNIGFDIGNDDDDNGGARDGQMVWNGTVNNYQNTSAFATLTLNGSNSSFKKGVAGAPEASLQTEVVLMPNPMTTGDLLTILTPAEWEGAVEVEIYNFQGVLVQKTTQSLENVTLVVNTNLQSGKYIVHLRNGDHSVVKKLFIE